MEQNLNCPWPGPKPYDLYEGGAFFGRNNEIVNINRRILSQRLTVLTADSGVGKSSLLRAGLVYGLLRARSKNQDVKPVLLIHKWSGAKDQPIEDIFREGLIKAIDYYKELLEKEDKLIVEDKERFLEQAKHDYQLLSSAHREETFR